MDVRCVVAGFNSNGEPDFYFVIVAVDSEQLAAGSHYEAALQTAAAEGYEGKLAYSEFDTAGRALLPLFAWESASRVTPYGNQ